MNLLTKLHEIQKDDNKIKENGTKEKKSGMVR